MWVFGIWGVIKCYFVLFCFVLGVVGVCKAK